MKYRASTVWLPASLMWGWAFLLHPPAQSLLPPSLVLTDWNESCSPGWGINKVFMILFLCVSRKWLSFEVMLFTTKMFIGLIPGGRISPQQGSVSKQLVPLSFSCVCTDSAVACSFRPHSMSSEQYCLISSLWQLPIDSVATCFQKRKHPFAVLLILDVAFSHPTCLGVGSLLQSWLCCSEQCFLHLGWTL